LLGGVCRQFYNLLGDGTSDMVSTGLSIEAPHALCVLDVNFVNVNGQAYVTVVACGTGPLFTRAASENENVISHGAVLAFGFVGVGQKAQSFQVVDLRSSAHCVLPVA